MNGRSDKVSDKGDAPNPRNGQTAGRGRLVRTARPRKNARRMTNRGGACTELNAPGERRVYTFTLHKIRMPLTFSSSPRTLHRPGWQPAQGERRVSRRIS